MISPLSLRMSRIALEAKILRALSETSTGLTLSDLRQRFLNDPVIHTVEHLVDRGQVHRYEGCIYSLTPSGRSRLSPPVCVAT